MSANDILNQLNKSSNKGEDNWHYIIVRSGEINTDKYYSDMAQLGCVPSIHTHDGEEIAYDRKSFSWFLKG